MPSNEGKFLGPDFIHCFDAPVANFVVSLIQYPSYFERQELVAKDCADDCIPPSFRLNLFVKKKILNWQAEIYSGDLAL